MNREIKMGGFHELGAVALRGIALQPVVPMKSLPVVDVTLYYTISHTKLFLKLVGRFY